MIDPKDYAYGVGLTRRDLQALINALATLSNATLRQEALRERLSDILARREAGDTRDLAWAEPLDAS